MGGEAGRKPAVDPNPWDRYFYKEKVDSTNRLAADLIRSGTGRGIVMAGMQTQGRGRTNKSWYSPRGENIYITFFSGVSGVDRISTLSQAAALAVYETAETFVKNSDIKIKWPNDVLINGKKTAGILGETVSHAGSHYYIIGIGLNLETPDKSRFEYNWMPTSFCEESGEPVIKEDVLRELVHRMDNHILRKSDTIRADTILTDTIRADMIRTDMIRTDITHLKYLTKVKWLEGRRVKISLEQDSGGLCTVAGFSEDGTAIKVRYVHGPNSGKTFKLLSCSIEEIYG